MKNLSMLSLLLAATLFSACGTTDSSLETESSSNEEEEQLHNQGVSCASCHSSASLNAPQRSDENEEDEEDDEDENENNENESSDEVFDSGATVFVDLHANNEDLTKLANGYTLQLLLSNGDIEKYVAARGTGNFKKDSFNAGMDKYTAQVLDANGLVLNSSATDSHDTSRLDCNSCHTAAGTNGAPGRIVPTTTESIQTPTVSTSQAISFASDVEPLLQSSCASCHGSSGSFSITSSSSVYAGVLPFVKAGDANNSSLLQKASGSVGHGGGTIWSSNTTAYVTVKDWIEQGALNN